MAPCCSGWPTFPHVEAVKWSAPTADRFTEGMAAIADRLVVIDNQGLHVWGHILGGNGFVTHLSNFWPEYPLSIWRALEAHDYESVPAILGSLQVDVERLGRPGRRDQRRRGTVHQGRHGARRLAGRPAAAAGRPADTGPDGRARRSCSTRRASRAWSDPDRLTDAGQAGRDVAITTPLDDVTDRASLSFRSLMRDN